MPDDHPGFELWDVNDAAHPFPVGETTVRHDDESFARAEADWSLPQTQPTPKTVAERSVGIQKSSQMWFALECTTDAQGQVVSEAVLRGKHTRWFPLHGETDSGPRQEIRLSMAEMRAGGRREMLAAHGPHCDLFSAAWWLVPGGLHCELTVMHVGMTVQGFLDARAKADREAERLPRPRVIIEPLPDPDKPEPEPPPKPAPDPGEGAMKPPRPGGVLGAIVGFLKRLAWGIFG